MWEGLVRARGGVLVGSLPEAAQAELGRASLLGVAIQDDAILPAVAKLEPQQAAAFLALATDAPDPGLANRALATLRGSDAAIYLLKWGRVGGTDPERSLAVTEAHGAAILDAIAAATIEWEDDPDFGYRVAAAVPGIEGRERFVLIPRFLYARTDRVYEYAALVPEIKRWREDRLGALEGLDPAIVESVR
jgi:phosphoenolpyruvate carboxykinase (ATP)